jgi:peptidoglycan hydrolase-like protein with peptidoglycan-binding domain
VEIIMTTNYAAEPITKPTTTRKPVARIVAAIVAGAIAIGGIATALVLVFGPVNMNPPNGTFPSGGKIMVHPSDEVKRLQEALTQLNYYEGPIDGYRNQQTKQAITDLQREAGLPQTGQMNLASWTALTTLLVEGNNQMNT